MNLKKRLALGVFTSTLLAVSAYYAEYLPFTGKWIAAYRMDRYAQEQYPGVHCGKVYWEKMVVALVSYWAALPESARADTRDVEAVYRHYATKREE